MNALPDPRLSRRSFLGVAAATGAALEKSPLIYLSPLRSDGAESKCHGEVWYVRDGAELLVVTAADRWKALAVRRGLDRARIWVGDFGQWKKSDGRFKTGPSFLAKARFDAEESAIETALAAFGAKYPDEWDKWEPRFRKGLADGSRVLIRYRPSGAQFNE
jgi:hypothetical protein